MERLKIPDSTPLSTGPVYCISEKVKAGVFWRGESWKGSWGHDSKGVWEPVEKWKAKGQRGQ
uniref:Uncharacterized protein n=1 Tax=Arundo donax TaxID=35708 RepID=A0A0A8Y9M8_ARUDO